MTLSFRAHAINPREIGVVEHSGVLDVLAGIHNGAGRSADVRCNLVILKCHARLHQALMTRKPITRRQLAASEMPLLVREDKDDVAGLARLCGNVPRSQ